VTASQTGETPGEPAIVRPAERADLLEIFRIEKASFPEPWPYAAFERFLDEPGFLVAARGADVLGYAVCRLTPDHDPGRDLGHLKDLAVRPDERRRGIGRLLVTRSLARMAAAGAVRAKLEVRASNDGARALYRRVGFEPARRLPGYYGDGEDALLMLVDLREWSGSTGPATRA
jgi:ribosomal-protein-alanine N-acetyltransferase